MQPSMHHAHGGAAPPPCRYLLSVLPFPPHHLQVLAECAAEVGECCLNPQVLQEHTVLHVRAVAQVVSHKLSLVAEGKGVHLG